MYWRFAAWKIEENWGHAHCANLRHALKRADFSGTFDTGLNRMELKNTLHSFGGHVKVRFGTMASCNVFDMEISQISIGLDHYGIASQVLRELDS